ncbi:MAG: hypothetical protein JWN86_4430 [Planctomycetota bacterium]|nr:hypothetical protein [Planctomycetota bacterium]
MSTCVIPVFLTFALLESSSGLAEVPAKRIVGRWLSQDADRQPLVFENDGRFEYGFAKKDGEWIMAKGTYTISMEGKIVASARSGGVTLGLRYTLKDDVVHGPRGPDPKMQWRQEER